MQRSIATIGRSIGLRRHHVAALRMRAEREVLARVGNRNQAFRSRILCYHGVGTPSWGVNDLSTKQFVRQLEFALAAGYRFVTLDDAIRTAAPNSLAVTFDDGLASVVNNAAPILRDFGIPFTVFVVSDWADGRHGFADGLIMDWRDLWHLAEAGASIGSHSIDHPNFGRITADEAARQLRVSRETISARLGIVADTFAIPFGRSTDWTAETAAAADVAGYKSVLAQSEDARPPGTIPRTFVAHSDNRTTFRAALEGAFDGWEEWW